MSQHELIIEDTGKVTNLLDELSGTIKDMRSTVNIAACIGEMDLAVGGVSTLLKGLAVLEEPLQAAEGTVAGYGESLRAQVAIFERNNENMTLGN